MLTTYLQHRHPLYCNNPCQKWRIRIQTPTKSSIRRICSSHIMNNTLCPQGTTDWIQPRHMLQTSSGPWLPIQNTNICHSVRQSLETHHNNHHYHQQHNQKIGHRKADNRHLLQTPNTMTLLPSHDHPSTNHTTSNGFDRRHQHIPTKLAYSVH